MAATKDEPLVKDIERAIKSVLSATDLTPADRIRAIEAGTKLLAVKNKLGDTESVSFFGNKRKP